MVDLGVSLRQPRWLQSCEFAVVLVLAVGFLGSLLNDVLDVAWTIVVFFGAVLKWVGSFTNPKGR